MSRRLPATGVRPDSGSALLVALLTTAILGGVVGLSLVRITSRSQIAARAAAWHQAGLTCETAADTAIAEIRRVLPEILPKAASPWGGWSAIAEGLPVKLPTDKTLAGLMLTFNPPSLLVGLDGLPLDTAVVNIDAPTGLVDSANRQWLRVRATGTAPVPGWRQASQSKLDNRLRGFAFVRDARTGAKVDRPQVTRRIEVIVRPVPLFGAAIVCQGRVSSLHRGAVVDSYDSSDVLKSTLGEYDFRLRQSHGDVYTNGTALPFLGTIYGTAGTNGGTLSSADVVATAITNAFYRSLPPIQAPAWSVTSVGLPASTALTVSGVSLTAPTQYKLSEIAGDLTVSGLPGSSVEVWVTGDVTGKILVNAGVKATFYIAGDIRLGAGNLLNQSHRPANLRIMGLQPPEGVARAIDLKVQQDIHATIYAPGHALQITGNGHFMGAVIAQSLALDSKTELHFDEALTKEKGPIADYQAASWVEEVP